MGLTLWDGEFEAVRHRWLRWVDEHGVLIPTGREQRQCAERVELLADERQHRLNRGWDLRDSALVRQ